jgi:hypothetical protein
MSNDSLSILFFLNPTTFSSQLYFLTPPPSPPLNVKGRSEPTVYHGFTPFPLTLRGRAGDRV